MSDGGSGSTSLIATNGTINEIGTLIAGTLYRQLDRRDEPDRCDDDLPTRLLNLGSFAAAGFMLNDGTGLTVASRPVNGGSATIYRCARPLTVNGSLVSSQRRSA